ncbi:MAG: lipoyl(octanoyl) transferase LipB [Candidatus Omnitrophota bacterium]|nr:lipoyl(octanoyl) transferase LipB [Candidatus Omnitrophota bacterium]
MKPLNVIDLGVCSYKDTYAIQKKILAEKKIYDYGDFLILVEHPNVFTIGRSGSRKNILADEDFLKKEGIDVIETDRGGDITFHGIGQLVAYPLFDLRNHGRNIRLFIEKLERLLILVVSGYGIKACGGRKHTGVWIGGGKIGFIGIGISNWITYHGASLNTNVDLKYFSMIKPCGIDGLSVTSLKDCLNRRIDPAFLKKSISEKFCEVFGFDIPYSCKEEAFVAPERAS